MSLDLIFYILAGGFIIGLIVYFIVQGEKGKEKSTEKKQIEKAPETEITNPVPEVEKKESEQASVPVREPEDKVEATEKAEKTE